MQHDTTTTIRSGRRAGFTLVELLLVIAIIAIVLALILVAINKLQNQARATNCLANQRQLALANQAYASDNAGRLASPRTDRYPPEGPMKPVPNSWVDTAGALSGGLETVKSLEQGALWEYLDQNPRAYVSPQDPTGRVRSYSFNAFVGVGDNDYDHRCDDLWLFPDPGSPETPDTIRGQQFKTVTMAQIPQPSRTMATITEDDAYGYNTQGWCIRVRPPASTAGDWIDTPAIWNTGRVNISYMDGSIDAPNIVYEQLEQIFRQQNHFAIETGTRPAFRFMSSILLPGIVRPEIQ